MPFDTLTLAASTADMEILLNSKITKIHQPDKYTVLLKFYGASGNQKLFLSAHPVYGRIHLTDENAENPPTPPMFCMVLRKHLDGARLIAIEQVENERIIKLTFDATDEIGEPTKRQLILEIMGKHSNLILLNAENNTILDGIKRYSHLLSRHREVLPNREYIAPPETNKINFSNISTDEFGSIFLSQDLDMPADKLLVKHFAGISPFLAKEIIHTANLDQYSDCQNFGAYELNALHDATKSIFDIIEKGDYKPVLLKNSENNGEYKDFYPIPVTSSQYHQEPQESISQALDNFYKLQKTQGTFKSEFTTLEKTIQKELARLTKKIAIEEKDLAASIDGVKFKEAGELITTYLYKLEKGMTEAYLEGYTEIDGEYQVQEIKVNLIPELTPLDNAKRYFHKYNKAKNAEQQIKEHLANNLEELEYMESLHLELLQAENPADLLEIRNELTDAGYLKYKTLKNGKKAKKVDANILPPREYQSSDGFTILVGRNNKQNDKLTMKTAAKTDIWFHTQKIPGSHTILRLNGGEPSETALREAAQLAAYHSKAQNSQQVPVDYTYVSQVKKPNGSKPGMVIYFEQKTLYVTPSNVTFFPDHEQLWCIIDFSNRWT